MISFILKNLCQVKQERQMDKKKLNINLESPATTFLVIEVQSSYSVILDCDWIHTNHCVPSTLHQFIIQWINDEIEVVHADTSAFIALADAAVDWQLGSTQYLSGRDLTGISKEGFVPVSVKPTSEARLGHVVCE
jgi:hypothetical protein